MECADIFLVCTQTHAAHPPVLGSTELKPTSDIRMYLVGSNINASCFSYLYNKYVLAAPFNSVFKFGVFNKIQSKCLNDVNIYLMKASV
jgi:hypothetical protein